MAETVAGSPTNLSSENHEQGYALEADSLMKQYENSATPALVNFNLHVQKGEFFGLLGPNGAGKTTVISILNDHFPPDSGTIRVMGTDFKRQPNRTKKIIGLVPQDVALYENLTAYENLAFFGKLYDLNRKQLQDRVERCIDFAGIKEQASRTVATYSGGMKRRLNLAAALLHEPQILFLDEPTVGIDTQSRHLIHKQLQALNHGGITILYTTHYMEEAQELCSRIGIMDSGRIIEQGTPEELLQRCGGANLEELFLRLTGRQLRDT